MEMADQVYVKVIGFSDVERHALNTVFRLSEHREVSYVLWQYDAPESPHLVLIDSTSYEAPIELATTAMSERALIWVGEAAHPGAWRSFQRPLLWAEVVQAMDELFASPPSMELDLQFGDGPDTQPPEPEPPQHGKRVLIVSSDRSARLYLRAKLALVHLSQADEAHTVPGALELAGERLYHLAVVDFSGADANHWALLRMLSSSQLAIPHLVVTKQGVSAVDRLRGWRAGAAGVFDRPPHPGKLHDLLLRVRSAPSPEAGVRWR